ncbi:hypothetical protein GOV11_03245, partial [Candidatus Woesearchaeota archaeon]|nr:hypothetical protein [Candidatus Woesearchaeota archaeon]
MVRNTVFLLATILIGVLLVSNYALAAEDTGLFDRIRSLIGTRTGDTGGGIDADGITASPRYPPEITEQESTKCSVVICADSRSTTIGGPIFVCPNSFSYCRSIYNFCNEISCQDSNDICTGNWECPPGWKCENGECYEPIVTECTANYHCPLGWSCINGVCEEGNTCKYDSDCPPLNCVSEPCVQKYCDSNNECSVMPMCLDETDCAVGYKCDGNNVCVLDCVPGTICSCAYDEQCPGDWWCDSGSCKEPVDKCVNSLDCPIGEFCVDGMCKFIEDKCTSDFMC